MVKLLELNQTNKSIFEQVCEQIFNHQVFKSKKLAITISLVQDDKILEVPFEKDLFKNYFITREQAISGTYKADNSNIEFNPTLSYSNSNKLIPNTTSAGCLPDNKFVQKVKLFNGQIGYFVDNINQIKIALLKSIEFYQKTKIEIYKKNNAINEIYGRTITIDHSNIESQVPLSFLIQFTLFPVLTSDYYSERKKLKDYNQILFFDLFYQSSCHGKTLDYLM